MYLSNIRIEGFRGIRSLDLRLGATTVLIGENNWGKASFFAALEKCLGRHSNDGPSFIATDAHCINGEPVDSLMIELTFRENREGELDDGEINSLAQWAVPAGDRRAITVTINASLENAGNTNAENKALPLSIAASGKSTADPKDALTLLRRFCPVLIVRPDRGIGSSVPPNNEKSDDHREQIEHQIEQVYGKLVSASQKLSPKEVDNALADVGELLHAHALRVMPEPPHAGELIESLGGIPQKLSLGGGPTMAVSKHGSATQAISLLVLTGALLNARGPRALDPMAMPLVVIEEPEAHLHPTLLAGIWGLIGSMNTQRVVTTYSGDLLADVALHKLRRLQRTPQGVLVHRVQRKSLDADDRRRLGYHIRALRGGVLFARSWILIEGETEFWLLPELARIIGHDLVAHGVRLIEFAQCGINPIAKLANDLGIPWHLLTDGDGAGDHYVSVAQALMPENSHSERIVQLQEKDIEHHLFSHGFAEVYRIASGRGPKKRRNEQPTSVIHAAIDAYSKPDLALRVIEAAESMSQDQLSPTLSGLINRAIASTHPAT